MNPRFPVYIISKNRPNRNPTRKMLENMGVNYYMVVEKQDYEAYTKNNTAHGTILILPEKYKEEYDTFWHDGDKRTGPGAARNFCWDHSISNGFDYHWVLDDNIESVERLNHNLKVPCLTGTCFYVMEDFVLRFENVVLAGPAYSFFVPSSDCRPPIKFNTRIYSFLLIKNNIPYRWRGRYNEDTDLSLRVLKDGLCTVQFNSFLQGKRATQTVKGGNDTEFYKQEGTVNKSKMLYDMHPDCVRLVIRWNRAHHYVNYDIFNNRPKLKKDYIPVKGINNFGMKLVRKTKKCAEKKMRKNKISIDKVQEAFNFAIKRRDKRCMIRDYEPCCGQLECSHFFSVGSSPSLRFYPPNAYAQCQKHHWNHHNHTVPFYLEWMENNRSYELWVMCKLKNKYIKYTDDLKAEIIRLCNADKLDELNELIESELSN